MKMLLSIALFVWIVGVMYFFNVKKAAYIAELEVVVSPTALAADKPLINFEFDRYKPDTSAFFHLLRDSLIAEVRESDELRITGYLSKMEAVRDSLLGLKRANATRALFQGYLDPDQIEIGFAFSDANDIPPRFEIVTSPKELLSSLPMSKENDRTNDVIETNKKVVQELPKPKIEEKPKPAKSSGDIVPPPTSEGIEFVVYFKENSSEILSADKVKNTIRQLEERVKASKQKLIIEGFDDKGRTEEESVELAKRRTWRVRKLFEDKYVRRKLLTIRNTGQSSLDKNEPEARRVEIRITN